MTKYGSVDRVKKPRKNVIVLSSILILVLTIVGVGSIVYNDYKDKEEQERLEDKKQLEVKDKELEVKEENSLKTVDYGLDKPFDVKYDKYEEYVQHTLGLKLKTKMNYLKTSALVGGIELDSIMPESGRIAIHQYKGKLLSVEIRGMINKYGKKDTKPYAEAERLANILLKGIPKATSVTQQGSIQDGREMIYKTYGTVVMYGVSEEDRTTGMSEFSLVLMTDEQYKIVKGSQGK